MHSVHIKRNLAAEDAVSAEAKATRQLELQQTKRSQYQGRLDKMDTRDVVVLVAHKLETVNETVQCSKAITNATLTSLQTQVTHLHEEMRQMKADFWRGFSETGVLRYFKRVFEAARAPSLNFVRLAHNWDMWDLVAKTLRIDGCPAKHLQIPLSMMKEVGATALQARRYGYSAEETRDAGYTMQQARAGGYPSAELFQWLTYPAGLRPSKIVNVDMWFKLGMMLPAQCREHVSMVVEGARSPQWFDAVVKGKRNVLIVIQDDRQQVFGGFCEDRLGRAGGWIVGSKNNFLFTLGKNGLGPWSKICSRDGVKNVHVSGCGLHFGNGANQLVAYDEWFFNPCKPAYTDVHPDFDPVDMSSCPRGSFLPQLVEVYECM